MIDRRMVLNSALAATAAAATGLRAAPGHSQDAGYPSQDLHFICGFAAGSGADAIVRWYADRIRPMAGRTIVVENRPGAGANIAIEYVARARPDGHTILVHGGSGLAANMHMYKKPPLESISQVQMIGGINKQAFMLVVDAKQPYQSVADLTAAMKKKGDKATYGTSAPPSQVMGAMYRDAAGLQSVDVNYKTAADGLNDLTSGAIDYALFDPVFATAQHKAGRLRVLGVSSGQRMAAAPEFPTMAESGVPQMNLNLWWAAMVPGKTPRPVVERLNGWFNAVTGSEETKAFLNNFASDPYLMTSDQAQAELEREFRDWAEYVRIAKFIPQG